MPFRHVFLVPNEWGKYHSSRSLEAILKRKISCDHLAKKIEGTVIKVEGVTARLRYHNQQPWMRKDQDTKCCPHPREYFGIYVSCNDVRYIYVYLVPREWLEGPWEQLEFILFVRISNYYRQFERISGFAIHYQGILGFLQFHDNLIWIRKCDDRRSKPDLKEYLAFSVPCIYCTER